MHREKKCQSDTISVLMQRTQNKTNHFYCQQHKCLGEWNSYERAPDSAEKQQTIDIWTDSAKKLQTIYIWTDSAKKQQTIYIWTDSAKKQQTIYIWTDSAKNCTGAFTVLQTVQKNNNSNLHMDRQCKKATAIYIWTVHIYRLYRRQCAKYTYIYSVHLVYYKDIIINDTLYTVWAHLHYVQYLYIMWSIHSNNVRCNRL